MNAAANTKAQPEDNSLYEPVHRLYAWLAFGPAILLILATGICPASLTEETLLPLFPASITGSETEDMEN